MIGLREGGLLETLIEGKTGVFFDSPDPSSLGAVLEAGGAEGLESTDCVAQSQLFSPERFRESFSASVAAALEQVEPRKASVPLHQQARRTRRRGLPLRGQIRS